MLSEGVKVTIDGKELDLVLNTEAMAQLCEEFGDLEGVTERLNNATYAERIRLIPRLIALLATQGEAVKDSGEVITAEYVTRHTLPKDIPALTGFVLHALEIGMNVKFNPQGGETDEVLAEILKNARGAAGN